MTPPPTPRLDRVIRAIASFAYVGYFPIASATLASAVTAILAWYFPWPLVIPIMALSLSGFLICKPAQNAFGAADPQAFVLDEVCGMLLSVLWLPKILWIYGLAFLLFRFFDVLKPWPIRLIQESKSPSSILWDDLLAGTFTNIILQIVLRFYV